MDDEQARSYFERLSNIDRKRWIAEEHYMREKFSIKTISDDCLEKLRMTPGQRYQ
jgi:hypothetical protein